MEVYSRDGNRVFDSHHAVPGDPTVPVRDAELMLAVEAMFFSLKLGIPKPRASAGRG